MTISENRVSFHLGFSFQAPLCPLEQRLLVIFKFATREGINPRADNPQNNSHNQTQVFTLKNKTAPERATGFIPLVCSCGSLNLGSEMKKTFASKVMKICYSRTRKARFCQINLLVKTPFALYTQPQRHWTLLFKLLHP